jgi:hypothetical protein
MNFLVFQPLSGGARNACILSCSESRGGFSGYLQSSCRSHIKALSTPCSTASSATRARPARRAHAGLPRHVDTTRSARPRPPPQPSYLSSPHYLQFDQWVNSGCPSTPPPVNAGPEVMQARAEGAKREWAGERRAQREAAEAKRRQQAEREAARAAAGRAAEAAARAAEEEAAAAAAAE